MNTDLNDIEKKAQIRTDIIKEEYLSPVTWIALAISILFEIIGGYLVKNHINGGTLGMIGYFLVYAAFIFFLVFIQPLFKALIVPAAIRLFLAFILLIYLLIVLNVMDKTYFSTSSWLYYFIIGICLVYCSFAKYNMFALEIEGGSK